MAHKEILDHLRGPVKDLRDHLPAVLEGYVALNAAGLGDAALDSKTAFREFAPR